MFIEKGLHRIFSIDSKHIITEVGERLRELNYKHFKMKEHLDNISNYIGYKAYTPGKGIIFNLVNKSDGPSQKLNKDGSKQKKSERSGGVCGQAKGAINKIELIKFINKLLLMLGYTGSPKYKGTSKAPIKIKTLRNKGKSLCEEVEILLRHLDWVNSEVKNNKRFFYSIEEKQFINEHS